MSAFAVGVGYSRPCEPAVVEAVASSFSPWSRPRSHAVSDAVHILTTGEDAAAVPVGDGWVVGDALLAGRQAGEPSVAELVAPLTAPVDEADRAARLAHTNGVFAAVYWDPRRRRITACRDFFGVRPLYFYRSREALWLSTLPGALLAAADAAGDSRAGLRPEGVFDRLIFGGQLDAGGTVWRHVERIAPGSLRRFDADASMETARPGLESPPVQRGLSEGAVAERVRAALDASVGGRLDGCGRASVWMSGGLDSTAVAASAAAVGADVVAHTVTYRRLNADREGEWAARAADHLGIAHRRHAVDEIRLFERWDTLPVTPLPAEPELDAMYVDIDRASIEHSDVAMTGFGADPLMLPERYGLWRGLARGGFSELWRSIRAFRRVGVRPPLGLATAWARFQTRRAPWRAPPWLSEDFAARVGAEERWRRFTDRAVSPRRGERAEARHHSTDLGWSELFEQLDAGVRGVPIRRRHPFFDLRVVDVLLGLPSMPWCLDKWALRIAQRGRLPDAVVRRPKTPLAGDPFPGHAVRPLEIWKTGLDKSPELGEFFDGPAMARLLESGSPAQEIWRQVGPALSLVAWRARWDSR
ncbi:MAG: asparagine synthase-related protein [Acidobacteriota bacterium]